MNYSHLVLLSTFVVFSCAKKAVIPDTSAQVVKKIYATNEFVMGADLSYANGVEDGGGVFKVNGKTNDVFRIFKEAGTNLVRVRLWHSPEYWQKDLNKGKIYSNLSDVEKTIRRTKEAGMAVLLDIHYADSWADPSKQPVPKAWEGLPLAILKDSVYNYTTTVLAYLEKKQLTPEYIQIGNEMNNGTMFPVGKIENNDFANFAILLKSGIKAVRDFSVKSGIKPKIILHVAQYQTADWWLNGLINTQQLTDFDIVGVSHYFNYSDLKTMAEVENTTKQLIGKYKKPLMVVETAFHWTNQNADSYSNIVSVDNFGGYGVSKTEQLRYMKDLTNALVKGGASGVIYWEPAWISSKMRDSWGIGSSWENNTFFDFEGNALPVFDYMTYAYPIK